jgi:hypothetical protein
MIRTRSVIGGALAAIACFSVGVSTPVGPVSAAGPATVTCDAVAATEPAPDVDLVSFDPMPPERIIDTRDGTGGVDAALGAGCTLVIDTGEIGPADAAAFALSVTVISPVKGFFTAFPCAAGLPGTSSINARAGFPTPNLVVATPDSADRVCLYSNRGGHVVVDVSGWWADGTNRFTPIDPVRAYDTRELADPVKLPAGAIRAVDVGGVVVPDDAVAVTVNLAAVAPATRGYLVVYPCGLVAPLASNLNFKAGEKRAASAIVEIGDVDAAASGKVCVTGNADTHFLLDVTGYIAPSSPTSPDLVLTPLPDERVVDSRDPAVPGVRFERGVVQRFDLGTSVERPDDMVAAVLNVVAVQADRAAFASVFPCQAPPPTTSSLNYDLAQTSNLVVSAVTDGGEICVVTNSSVEIVIDLVGVFTGPPGSLVNQLSLTDGDGALVPLEQDFAIDGENSTLRCDGAVELGLRLGLAPGVSAQINGVAVPPRDPVTPDVAVFFPAEGLVTVSLQRATESAEYHLRCLPIDFSPLTVTRTGETSPGWYLTELGWNQPTTGRFLVIMDERGVPVWFKRTGTTERLINAQLLGTGEIAVAPITGFGFGIELDPPVGHRVYDLDGTLIAERQTDDPASFPIDHHDYAELPGVGYGVLSYPLVTGVDLQKGVGSPDTLTLPTPAGLGADCEPSAVNDSSAIVDNVIREVKFDGELRWSWTMSDHFDFRESTFAQCFRNYPDDEIDVFHINSLQRIDDGTGDYLASARHLDAVFRVDRSTGDVDWILGSDPGVPNKKGAPRLEIVDDPLGGPLRMHDARIDGDVVTMYDNRTADPDGAPSRAVAYRIDTVAGTATLEWSISHPNGLTSNQIGSTRVTPDGSVLVGWGSTQPMFVEYAAPADGLGELMRIEISPSESAYRIVKYAPDAFAAAELRATAGGTLEIPAP